jgi:hypothetical protein
VSAWVVGQRSIAHRENTEAIEYKQQASPNKYVVTGVFCFILIITLNFLNGRICGAINHLANVAKSHDMV